MFFLHHSNLFICLYLLFIFSVFASCCRSSDPLSLKSAADNPVSTLVVNKPEFSRMNTCFSWVCVILNGIVIFTDAYLRVVTASPCGGVSALRLCSLTESWLTLQRNERHVRRRLRNISVTRIRPLLESRTRTSMNADSPPVSLSHTHRRTHTQIRCYSTIHPVSVVCLREPNKQTTSPLSDKWGGAESIAQDHTKRNTPVCLLRVPMWENIMNRYYEIQRCLAVILTVTAFKELRVNCVPVSVWSVSVLTSLTAGWASMTFQHFLCQEIWTWLNHIFLNRIFFFFYFVADIKYIFPLGTVYPFPCVEFQASPGQMG